MTDVLADTTWADAVPLSPAQQRLWFLYQLGPGAGSYVINSAIELRGPLAVLALRRAVDHVGRRHAALRSVFRDGPNGPVQRFGAAPALRLVDLTGPDGQSGGGEAALRQQLAGMAGRSLDLTDGPPARWTLFAITPQHHVLVLTVHHIAFDGASVAIVCRDLEDAYLAAVTGRPLPPSSADADFGATVTAEGPGTSAAIEFWRRELDSAPERSSPFAMNAATTSLPAVRSTERLAAEEIGALAAFCRRSGGTVYMVLAAALGCLVGRYGAQQDVVLGSPVSVRGAAESSVVGPFINVLPIRLRLTGEPGFADVVGQARDRVLDALENSLVPFERIVGHLGVVRDVAMSPVFQVLFAYQRQPDPLALAGVTGTLLRVPASPAQYELNVTAIESQDGLEIVFEADPALCDAGELAALAGHLRVLLRAALADPAAPVGRLSLLSDVERSRLAAPWAADEDGPFIHRLAERTAGRTPDATAVLHGARHLSYQALDLAAERLATRLRALGCGPDRVVGVWLPRTPELVVTLLAVLKAGSAYLPIGHDIPVARVSGMLVSGSATLLVSDDTLLAGLRAHDGELSVPTLVPDVWAPDRRAGRVVRTDVSPHALAYVLHTSGSTGRPKAVGLDHGNASLFVRSVAESFQPDELAAALAVTPVGFDLTVFELWVTLRHGGTVIMAENALQVPELPAARGATLINTVPSAVSALLDVGGLPPSVRAVNLAGEVLSRELADRLRDRTVRNVYGPAEATTYATLGVVGAERRPPTLGQAIGGVRVWVTDDRGMPVPDAMSGELRIGGRNVSRGYLGMPGRTADVFVPDPHGPPGSRAYRSGDVVRRRADGELDFVGRRDSQVQLRGIRVELGEVESALRAVAHVRDVAVVMTGASQATRHLVAFASPGSGERVEPDAVLADLRSVLPTTLVPTTLIMLDSLPRNNNGKVDRAALLVDADARVRDRTWTAPRTAIERAIATEWQRLLDVERVGVHDRFFDLGGNSLMLLRLHTALTEKIGVHLRLMDFFVFPDIESLAGHLTEQLGTARSVHGAVQRGRDRRRAAWTVARPKRTMP
jgi:nonribosomal peptide synthetase protein BlmIX